MLSRELFFIGVIALQTPIQKNQYMRKIGPFLGTVTYVTGSGKTGHLGRNENLVLKVWRKTEKQ